METTRDEINVWELLVICAKRKKMIIIITGLFIIHAVISSLLAPIVFEVTTTIAPRQDSKSTQLGNLGSIAGMMGVSLGNLSGGTDLRMVEYTLKNNAFLLSFDDAYHVLEEKKSNKKESIEGRLKALKRAIHVGKDEKKGLITIAVQGENPSQTYDLLIKLLKTLNATMVQVQSDESKKIIDELQREMARTSDPLLRAELSKLWAEETKKMLYSRINENSIYRIIDPPYIPQQRIKPRRAQTVIVNTMIGFFIALLIAFFIEYFETVKRDSVTGEYYHRFMEYMGFDKLPFLRRR